ncbi:MAG: dihydrolipoyl dehydrogenase [Bacteriovoracaceae bacterium]|jgi:dihydrolipoamide dehydrogenase|nr:dihydrolipoyl dehydrogenase [Bacteriovoracaceae bacterium]
MREVEVAIIGAGSGGLSARREVAKQTDNYVVIDGGQLGTTCARVGCMPSKVFIQVAEDFNRRFKFAEEGILGADKLQVDTKQVMQHVRKLRDRFVRGVLSGMDSWQDKFISGHAKFLDEHHLEVNQEKIYAKKIIIATGSKPQIPSFLAGFERFIITTDEFFEEEELPQSVAVLGLGVIGIELGQAMHRLGCDVVGIARRENISGITDPRLEKYVTQKFSQQMNLDYTGLESVELQKDRIKLKTQDSEHIVDKILVTIGRKAFYDSVNIGALKKTHLELGVPTFNKQTMQLAGYPHIFLAGDNTGENQILHEASDEGRIAGYNAVRDSCKEFYTRTPLMITFCDPNIVFAGKTYAEIEKSGVDFSVGEVLFEGQGRSIVKLKEIGMLRVYGETSTGKILGAELMAPDGEHLGHLLSWCISQELTVNQVLSFPFYHPVIEEGLRTALRDLRSKVQEKAPELDFDLNI